MEIPNSKHQISNESKAPMAEMLTPVSGAVLNFGF